MARRPHAHTVEIDSSHAVYISHPAAVAALILRAARSDDRALEAGAATIPTTLVMFVLSRRIGVLADRLGPRLFMAVGPPVSAGGVLYLIATVDESPGLLLEVLPGTTIFAVGLAIVLAPLTETVLSDADENDAGIASGVNNAVASRDFSRPPRSAARWTSAASGWLSPWPRVYSPVGGAVGLALSGAIVRSGTTAETIRGN